MILLTGEQSTSRTSPLAVAFETSQPLHSSTGGRVATADTAGACQLSVSVRAATAGG
jgi:hypothetical protein